MHITDTRKESIASCKDSMVYLEAVVAFTAAVFLFHTWLDFRQLRAIRIPKPPKYIAAEYSEQSYREKQAYNEDKWFFGLAHGAFETALTLAQLLLGYLPLMWGAAERLLRKLNVAPSEVSVAITYFFLDAIVHTAVGMPWSAWGAFVVEQRHGFNKQTVRTFVGDLAKSAMLAVALAPPLIGGFVYILSHTGPWVALKLWAFIVAVSLFMMTVYPTVIAPLFNTFEALPEGGLRDAVEALAGSLDFPLKKLYVIDGSRRSAHSNAYMFGFGRNKRIVLYDTLVKQCSEEQIVAVLAHELGHWRLRHTPVLFAVSMSVLLLQLSMFAAVRGSAALYEDFGFPPGAQPLYMGFALFQLIIAPMDQVVGFLSHVVTRAFEFQADGFAVSLGRAAQLKEALLVLDKENKSALNVDPLYSAFHHSHPPLVERLRAIDDAQAAGKKAE